MFRSKKTKEQHNQYELLNISLYAFAYFKLIDNADMTLWQDLLLPVRDFGVCKFDQFDALKAFLQCLIDAGVYEWL